MRIFVYGTLKRGYGNNRILANSKQVADGALLDGYSAIYSYKDCGFPVAFRKDGAKLQGEIYDISGPHKEEILRRLDSLEGEGYMYHRRYNEVLDAWFYEGGDIWDIKASTEVASEDNTTYIWQGR